MVLSSAKEIRVMRCIDLVVHRTTAPLVSFLTENA
jgi:hypothetical protein